MSNKITLITQNFDVNTDGVEETGSVQGIATIIDGSLMQFITTARFYFPEYQSDVEVFRDIILGGLELMKEKIETASIEKSI